MTISTTTSRASYNGNGVTTVFSVPFRFFASTDLAVELVTVSTGASTTLMLTTHYTVTGADDESGGSLTMLTAPAVGQRLVIRRVIAATQEVDYVAGDPFPAETHERALDRLTMLAQQGEEVNARALVFPSGDTASGELPEVVTRASKLLGFNASGDLTVSAPASGSAAELALDLASTASGKGAELVGFKQSGTGAVDRTVRGKFAEWVSINDFGAVSGVNSTVAIAAVFASGATHITAAPGTYLVADELTIPAGVTFDAQGAKFVQTAAAKNIFKFNASHGAKLLNAVLEGYATDTGPAFELANGVYAFGSDRIEIRGCTVYGFEYNGIFLRNCNDYVVDGNLLHSNRYINNTSADILAYSTALSRGGFITNNRCNSNNSQGIYIGAGGFDADCTIEGNRCITLDSSFAEVVTPNVKRRHGIQIGYGGTSHRRHIVVGNVIKVTSSTGIYYQGHYDTSSGSVLIAYNYIKDTGIDTVQAPLSSGITLACQGEGDVVVGNVIEGTFVGGVIGTSAGISLQPNTGGVAVSTNRHTLIQGNTVTGLAGSGIQAINEAVNVTIADNRITGAGIASIFVSVQPISGAAHSCRIINNSIRHSVDTVAAIHITATAGSGLIEVRGNEMIGPNNTTSNVNNAGVFIANATTAGNKITIDDNYISTFRCGVSTGFYLSAAVPTVLIRNNRFADLSTGIAAGGTGGRLVGTGNTYENCTANTGGGPLAGASNAWEGLFVNGTFHTYLAAAPTTGVWSVGDRVQRNPPAVGQPKAWSCTVAGVPGTWVSEGNL